MIAFRNIVLQPACGLIGCFLATLIVSTYAIAAETCQAAAEEINGASRVGDTAKAAKLFEQAERGSICSGLALALMGRTAALAFHGKATKPGISPDERQKLLAQGIELARPWQLLAALGDGEKAAKDYARAAQLYQEALEDIVDEKLNPVAPDQIVIARLYKKAEEMSLLAPVYVTRRDRSGRAGGLSRRTFRSFTTIATAVPVHFEFNKTEFTIEGRKAAEDMFRYLTQQGAPRIELIGHTDPRGGDEFNQRLSEGRAQAVRDYLKGRGYTGEVQITGRGKREPFQMDDPDSYSPDEQYQLHRRVELIRP
jgi:outer membrane protein OmpA-like peptidoglycan-associated protein